MQKSNLTQHMSAQEYRELTGTAIPGALLEQADKKAAKTPRRHDEDDMSKEVAAYLDDLKVLNKILVFSHLPLEEPTAPIQVKMKRKAMGVRRGVPDFLIVGLDGRCLFLELKTETGVVSPFQKEWFRALSAYESLNGKNTIQVWTAIGAKVATEIIDNFVNEKI
jgi:hypothetical protein